MTDEQINAILAMLARDSNDPYIGAWAADWHARLSSGDEAEWQAFQAQMAEMQRHVSDFTGKLAQAAQGAIDVFTQLGKQ